MGQVNLQAGGICKLADLTLLLLVGGPDHQSPQAAEDNLKQATRGSEGMFATIQFVDAC